MTPDDAETHVIAQKKDNKCEPSGYEQCEVDNWNCFSGTPNSVANLGGIESIFQGKDQQS